MSQLFTERFAIEIGLLGEIYGHEMLARYLPRVQEIHEHTEDIWQEYVQSLGSTPVRYLLIAEAPPWSETGRPQYVLDPESRSRSFMAALRGAFVGRRSATPSECLSTMASEGFLLLDSIPFAMNYSSKRGSKKYDRLIGATVNSYLQAKIDVSTVTWSSDVRVAFAVTRNARSIIKAKGHLKLGGLSLPLSADAVAVNGAGYPDAKKLREVFCLG